MNGARGEELAGDGFDKIRRDRKAQADVARSRAARIERRRVDADEPSIEIDQRTTRVAGVDGGVGLDEVLVACPGHDLASDRRHDPRRHRLPNAKRIPHRHHEVAHAQRSRITQRQRRQLSGRNAHHRDVRRRIRTHELGLQGPPVRELHRHIVRAFNHVVVRDDQPAFRVDDDARTERLRLTLLRQSGKHLRKNRIIPKR